jgi:hypothetical protein
MVAGPFTLLCINSPLHVWAAADGGRNWPGADLPKTGAYDQKDAAGFIKLNALRLRTLGQRDRKG